MAETIAKPQPRTPVYSSISSAGLLGRLRTLFERRDLIWELTARNLKVRYRRSVFGFLWAILNPLLNALVFGFVFGVLLKSPIDRFVLFVLDRIYGLGRVRRVRAGIDGSHYRVVRPGHARALPA